MSALSMERSSACAEFQMFSAEDSIFKVPQPCFQDLFTNISGRCITSLTTNVYKRPNFRPKNVQNECWFHRNLSNPANSRTKPIRSTTYKFLKLPAWLPNRIARHGHITDSCQRGKFLVKKSQRA